MKKLLIAALLPFALMGTAQANIDSPSDVPTVITVDGTNIALNGAGMREKFWMDLYVGSLYTVTAAHSTADALSATAVVRLNIVSDMITSEKMAGAIMEGLETATDGDMGPIQAEADHFVGLFASETLPGDQFTFVAKPGAGLEVSKNGSVLSTIESDAFAKALFNVWLGPDAEDEDLREDMLDL